MTVRLPVNGDRFRVVEIHKDDDRPCHKVGKVYKADFASHVGPPSVYKGSFIFIPRNKRGGMRGLFGTWARIEFLDEPKEAEKPAEDFDPVKKPKHYNIHPSGVECIEITRHHNFCVGNAIKYLWRQGLKSGEPSVKDLKKAAEYIGFEIARLEATAK